MNVGRSKSTDGYLPECAWVLAFPARTLNSFAFFSCAALVLTVLLPRQGCTQDLSNTLNVSCGGKLTAKDVKSSVLTSPQNANRAYSEISVRPSARNCANSSRLFVQSPWRGKQYNLVFLQEPTDLQQGNGIRIVDWSRDGRLLLFEVILWQYGSDARPDKDILIYDTKSGVFSPLRFEDFIRQFGEGCFVTMNPAGFSPDNQAVLEVTARQDYDEEHHPVKPRCAERKGLWSYDPSTYKMKALTSANTVQHWGTIAAQQESR